MIAASQPREFVPFGRQQVIDHPGAVPISSDQRQKSEGALLNQLTQCSISDSVTNESWILRETLNDAATCQEELYFKDKTVVWSVGPSDVELLLDNERGNRVLKCCYTGESKVQQALWCNFHLSTIDITTSTGERHEEIQLSSDLGENNTLKNCICIMDLNYFKFFTSSGSEFMSTLQFPVSRLWVMKFGLLIERKIEKKEDVEELNPKKVVFKNKSTTLDGLSNFDSTQYMNLPTYSSIQYSASPNFSTFNCLEDKDTSSLPVLFSLSHPLDEIYPVVSKKGNSLSYMSDPDVSVVFTDEQLSICLTYNAKTKCHSIHEIRKANHEESEDCLRLESLHHTKFQNSFGVSSVRSPMGSNNSFNLQQTNISLPAFLNTKTRKSLGLPHSFVPNIANSPISFSDLARHSSPLHHSPLSPAFTHSQYTPPRKHATSDTPMSPFDPPPTPSRMENRMMNEDNQEPKPLLPQICLQHLWIDEAEQVNGKACKAFLSSDLLGLNFLCYLIQESNSLHLIQIETRSTTPRLKFIPGVKISAKDAEYVSALKMIIVITLENGLELYSGVNRIAKLLVSGSPRSMVLASYFSKSKAGQSLSSRISTGSFPKRSSLLLPQGTSPSFDESLSHLSPVQSLDNIPSNKLTSQYCKTPLASPIPREGLPISLRDSVSNRVSLEYSTGILFRIQLPSICDSSLVRDCLNTIKQVLPKNVALQTLVKWYCVRNVPGSHNIDYDEEWKMFSNMLLNLLGYNTEKLNRKNNKDENSPIMRPKKRKTQEAPSDADWMYLLNSKHHRDCYKVYLPGQKEPTWIPDDEMEGETSPVPSTSSLVETPVIRSMSDTTDTRFPNQTPAAWSRASFRRYRSFTDTRSLDDIDETPSLQPLAKIARSRFQSTLDKGQKCTETNDPQSNMTANEKVERDNKALLYHHDTVILFVLHLLYEDMKLNTLKHNNLRPLVLLLYHLAKDLGFHEYTHHYWLDFPCDCTIDYERKTEMLDVPLYITKSPPNIFQQFYYIVLKKDVKAYPYLKHVNKRSRDLIQVLGLLSFGYDDPRINLDSMIENINSSNIQSWNDKGFQSHSKKPIPHRVLLLMTEKGLTRDELQSLPPGVSLILHEALYYSREKPGDGWSREAYRLAMRQDLASLCRHNDKKEVGPTNELVMPTFSNNFKNNSSRLNVDLDEDGMEDLTNMDVLKLRFSNDQRVLEARRLLQSAHPVSITIQQRSDVSDHEFIQQQEKHLYAICTRTMALPVGRGMITLRTSSPVVNEPLPIPPLCLTGRVPPTDKVVDMSHIEVVANMNVWSLFHNGVAAGLRISPHASDIDPQWIFYNKPKNNNDELIEHAGFLMGLGLNGHLGNLEDIHTYQYLIKTHEMTSVGLLLGMAACKRGTMDVATVKALSVHIEAMLPPTGIELNYDVIVEPAAIIGLGFLYQNTTNRHIAQVLLQEIGRPPGPEMENSVDRESYSLAAGLALGLVAFGKGSKLSGLADLALPDTLHHYMVGGPKRKYLGSQREKYKTPSYLIWEGDLVNTNVTGPGATLALGMIYFNTHNRAVAEWLDPPETQHLLEMVLPDALLLRTLAKGLIMWQDIKPSEEWIVSLIPAFIVPYCLVKPQLNDDQEIDYETINQAYCNIVAGACMAMGLRFAGSGDEDAFDVLLSYAKRFTSLLTKSIAELCGRSTIETCLNVIVVSLAMVMAGTGNVEVLRLCRYLRSRVGPSLSVVTYGSHLSTHMAIGLLFIGGGTHTLSSSAEAIPTLLCAFYPKWPIHSNDNRYHLQALRHLYVLAAEPRLLLPRDIDTRTLTYVHITVVDLRGEDVRMRAPCLLPQLDLISEVRIEDDRYWSMKFTRSKNWDIFKTILLDGSFIDVKQRAGRLSYIEDPQGYRSLLSQTLTSDDVLPWTVNVESIFAFSSDPIMVNFAQYFLDGRNEEDKVSDLEEVQLTWLTSVSYYCLTKDKLALLPLLISLLKLGQNLLFTPSVGGMWQLKLVWTHCLNNYKESTIILPTDMALAMKQQFSRLMLLWESDLIPKLKKYINGDFSGNMEGLISYLIFHDIPPPTDLKSIFEGKKSKGRILAELMSKKIPSAAALKLLQVSQESKSTFQFEHDFHSPPR